MQKRAIPLNSWKAKQAAKDLIDITPEGYECVVQEITRTNDQNKKLHAVLTDISEQVEWKGLELSVVQWKRLCTYAWLREIGENPIMVPALDGVGMDIIYERTSQMGIKQVSSLTEWVIAFGTENNVTFKDFRWKEKF